MKQEAHLPRSGAPPQHPVMLSEIHEQPRAVEETLREVLGPDGRMPVLGPRLTREELLRFRRIEVIGSGTSYHAALIAQAMLEDLAGLPVEARLASEIEPGTFGLDSLTVVISQSGETADTLAGMREARRRGAHVIAITNAHTSTLAREADCVLITRAGEERAVAATKTFVAELVAVTALAVSMTRLLGTARPGRLDGLVEGLRQLPRALSAAMATEAQMADLAETYNGAGAIYYVGRGLDYITGIEGAMKLKEAAGIHAEACAAGELKHHTLALVGPDVPVFALATQPHVYEKMLSNINVIRGRGGKVIGVIAEGDSRAVPLVDHAVCVPAVDPLLAPAVTVVPLQLFACYAGMLRGRNVDNPPNLNKIM